MSGECLVVMTWLVVATVATDARADTPVVEKRVAKQTFRFTPPTTDKQNTYDFVPSGAAIPLQLGDRVVFQVPKTPSTLAFQHTCFKAGSSIFGIPLSKGHQDRKTVPFTLAVGFKFAFKGKPLDVVVPPMTYVAAADGLLTAETSPYSSPKFDEEKKQNPCDRGFEHRNVTWTNPSPIDVTVIVCRAGVGSDSVECK